MSRGEATREDGWGIPGGGSSRQPRRKGAPTTAGIGSGREGEGGSRRRRGVGAGIRDEVGEVLDGVNDEAERMDGMTDGK